MVYIDQVIVLVPTVALLMAAWVMFFTFANQMVKQKLGVDAGGKDFDIGHTSWAETILYGTVAGIVTLAVVFMSR